MTAKLPAELRSEKPRLVSELRSGETGYVYFVDLLVNLNEECFLRAGAELRKHDRNIVVEVRRDDAGFHVVIPSDRKYTPEKLISLMEVLPVASISIGPSCRFDEDTPG